MKANTIITNADIRNTIELTSCAAGIASYTVLRGRTSKSIALLASVGAVRVTKFTMAATYALAKGFIS